MAISTKFFLFNKNKDLGGFRGAILSSGSSVISFSVRPSCSEEPATIYIDDADITLDEGVEVYTDGALTTPYTDSSFIYLTARYFVTDGVITFVEVPFKCAVILEVYGNCEQTIGPFTVYGPFPEGIPHEFPDGTPLYDDPDMTSSEVVPNEFTFEGIVYSFSPGSGTMMLGHCEGGEG